MTDVAEITDERALTVLREVVAERPEYVYSAPDHMKDDLDGDDPSCYYAHADEDGAFVAPGCAIGVALNRLGVPLKTLAEHEGVTAYSLVKLFFPGLSRKTIEKFNSMQMYQDSGTPWGLSFAKATGETI
jgi:hypothetical protein